MSTGAEPCLTRAIGPFRARAAIDRS